MDIQYEMLSETGLKRSENQDSITAHVHNELALFAVADGMGGHSQGDYASRRTIAAIDEWWNDIRENSIISFQELCDMTVELLEKINSEIYGYAASQKITCGSTVSVLLVHKKMYAVINLGDSPVFYVNSKYSCRASTEHSYDAILKKSLENDTYIIDERRVGKLLQALGAKERVYPSIRTGMIDKKHIFMLCSDGISRYFTDKEIFRQMKKSLKNKLSLQELCTYFKERVYSAGAADNLSEIIISAEPEKTSDMKKIIIASVSAAVILLAWAAAMIIQILY